jgi:hypothetical protein
MSERVPVAKRPCANIPVEALSISKRFTENWKKMTVAEIERLRDTANNISKNAGMALEALEKVGEIDDAMEL